MNYIFVISSVVSQFDEDAESPDKFIVGRLPRWCRARYNGVNPRRLRRALCALATIKRRNRNISLSNAVLRTKSCIDRNKKTPRAEHSLSIGLGRFDERVKGATRPAKAALTFINVGCHANGLTKLMGGE